MNDIIVFTVGSSKLNAQVWLSMYVAVHFMMLFVYRESPPRLS